MIHHAPTGRKFKMFVKETNCIGPLKTLEGQTKYLPVTPLTGDKAKQFYEEILSQPASSPEKEKPKPLPKPQPCCKSSSQRIFKKTDLLWMAQNNDIENLNSFLLQEPSSDINIADDFGWTPLMCASCSGAEEAVKILLKNGADPNRSDRLGNTALTLAKQKSWVRITEMLENYEKECKNEEGRTEDLCEPFFCQTCQENFMSKHKHESSTVHLFNCPIKTCTFYGIPESNKGFQLLLREGWQKDTGLGPDGRGRKFPVKAVMKKDKKGIGAPPLPDKTRSGSIHVEKYECKKRRTFKMWKDKHFEKHFRLEFL